MYYIYQASGKQADKSHECWQALKDGNLLRASRLYRDVMGVDPMETPCYLHYGDTWLRDYLMYTGTSQMCRHHNVDISRMRSDSLDAHYWLADQAARLHGGEWAVGSEY